jgi:hypothetical protein
MTQTLYAHMNKKIQKKDNLCITLQNNEN